MGIALAVMTFVIFRLILKIRTLKTVNATLTEKDQLFIKERLIFLSSVSQLRLAIDILNLESCKNEMIRKENYEAAGQINKYIEAFTQFNTYKFKY